MMVIILLPYGKRPRFLSKNGGLVPEYVWKGGVKCFPFVGLGLGLKSI